MKFHSLILFLLVLAVGNLASAGIMTLDDCINTALKNNVSIIGAQNNYESSIGQTYAAYGQILPSIGISSSGSRSWSGRSGLPASHSYSGSLTVGQTYAGLGLGTYADIKQSTHSSNSAFYNVAQTRSGLILLVKQNYYSVLQAKMLEGVFSDAVARSAEGLRVAQSRYELGSASLSDVLQAKVQLGSDSLDLITQENSSRSALANLAFTMGIDVNQDFNVPEGMPERQEIVDYNTALNEALSKNPQYLKSQMDLQIARDAKLSSYSSLLPSLSLGVTHSTGAGRLSDFPTFVRDNAGYSASMSLNFNIFRGFGDYSSIRTAKRNVSTNRANVSNIKNNVALAIKQVFLDIHQAEESIKLSDASVASAQENMNLVKEKYRLGAATSLDVLTAEVSLKQAQTNQIQALFNYNLAVARLDNAMGR
jgi:outer membrane protein